MNDFLNPSTFNTEFNSREQYHTLLTHTHTHTYTVNITHYFMKYLANRIIHQQTDIDTDTDTDTLLN